MNNELRTNKGLTLTETTIVIAIVALLAVLGLPAARVMFNSMVQSPAGTKAMIGAALSSARAIAAKERRYAGVRFQEDYNGDQYMIFIINDGHLQPVIDDHAGYIELEFPLNPGTGHIAGGFPGHFKGHLFQFGIELAQVIETELRLQSEIDVFLMFSRGQIP